MWLVVARSKLALPWGPALPWSLSDLHRDVRRARRTRRRHRCTTGAASRAAASPHRIARLVARARARSGRSAPRSSSCARSSPARSAPLAPRGAPRAHSLPPSSPSRIGVRAASCRRRADVGPHVVGVLRPIIVVPAGAARRRDAAPRRAAPRARARSSPRRARPRRSRSSAGAADVVVAGRAPRQPPARCSRARPRATRGRSRPASPAASLRAPARRMAELRAPAAPALAARPRARRPGRRRARPAGRAPRIGAVHALALLAWAVLALGGARTAAAHARVQACNYSPELAQALYASYPEADLDGDGSCRATRRASCRPSCASRRSSYLSPLDPELAETLLAEPLCCNCDRGGAYSSLEKPRAARTSKESMR